MLNPESPELTRILQLLEDQADRYKRLVERAEKNGKMKEYTCFITGIHTGILLCRNWLDASPSTKGN